MASTYIYIGIIVGGGALLFVFGPYLAYILGAPLSNAFNTENRPYLPEFSPGPSGFNDYRGDIAVDYTGNITVGQIISVDNINFKLTGVELSSPANYSNNLTINFAIKNRNAQPVELNGSMFRIQTYTRDGEFYRYYPVRLIDDSTGAESITVSYNKEYPATLLSTVGAGDKEEISYELTIFGKDRRVVFGLPS